MLDDPDSQKKESLQASENIEIPPIRKQTAGAVVGAAVGSVVGPIGAVVGGVAGALADKSRRKRTLDRPGRKKDRAEGRWKRQSSLETGA
jgi:uncharacterized membrane protein